MDEEIWSRIEYPPPEFEIEFVDDIFSMGHMTDVWTTFKKEITLSSKYGFEFDYSK